MQYIFERLSVSHQQLVVYLGLSGFFNCKADPAIQLKILVLYLTAICWIVNYIDYSHRCAYQIHNTWFHSMIPLFSSACRNPVAKIQCCQSCWHCISQVNTCLWRHRPQEPQETHAGWSARCLPQRLDDVLTSGCTWMARTLAHWTSTWMMWKVTSDSSGNFLVTMATSGSMDEHQSNLHSPIR